MLKHGLNGLWDVRDAARRERLLGVWVAQLRMVHANQIAEFMLEFRRRRGVPAALGLQRRRSRLGRGSAA
jgi:hypothetical protein